jgi:hypothetical protein
MGREGIRNHNWTEADEAALTAAVEALQPLMDHYANNVGSAGAVTGWWNAVAGRLAPGVLVTGAACKRRWGIMASKKRAELEAKDPVEPPDANEDGWQRTARIVEEYERTVGEQTRDGVEQIAVEVAVLRRMLVRLCEAWGVPVPKDGEP